MTQTRSLMRADVVIIQFHARILGVGHIRRFARDHQSLLGHGKKLGQPRRPMDIRSRNPVLSLAIEEISENLQVFFIEAIVTREISYFVHALKYKLIPYVKFLYHGKVY